MSYLEDCKNVRQIFRYLNIDFQGLRSEVQKGAIEPAVDVALLPSEGVHDEDEMNHMI